MIKCPGAVGCGACLDIDFELLVGSKTVVHVVECTPCVFIWMGKDVEE